MQCVFYCVIIWTIEFTALVLRRITAVIVQSIDNKAVWTRCSSFVAQACPRGCGSGCPSRSSPPPATSWASCCATVSCPMPTTDTSSSQIPRPSCSTPSAAPRSPPTQLLLTVSLLSDTHMPALHPRTQVFTRLKWHWYRNVDEFSFTRGFEVPNAIFLTLR